MAAEGAVTLLHAPHDPAHDTAVVPAGGFADGAAHR